MADDGEIAAVVGQHSANRRQRSRQKIIVAVQPAKHIAGGLRQSFVDRMTLTAIFFAAPTGQPRFVSANDRDAFVRAAAIHNDVFQLRVVLQQDRTNRLLQKACLIE